MFLPACRTLGVAFVPYSPLGRGFLTGRITSAEDFDAADSRRRSPRFQDENMKHNQEIARRVKQAAAKKGCTPAQIALAWLLAQGDDIVPIPGTKRRSYLEENLGALAAGLTAAEAAGLSEAIPADLVQGTRYSESFMKRVNI